MSPSTQSMSEFLDDLWSNLDSSQPARTADAVEQPDSRPAATTPETGASSPEHPRKLPAASVEPRSAQPESVQSESVQQTPLAVQLAVQRGARKLFYPKAPRSLKEADVSADQVGRLILKLLATRGAVTGRKCAAHIRLGFTVVEPVLNGLRKEQLVALKGDAIAGDYTYIVTQKGLSLAKELSRECTYFGAAPVTLEQYLAAMAQQSVADQVIRAADLKHAFSDLLLEDDLLKLLGPAINSGRGMFLFGEAGNGKTSIAERIARSFGTTMWIPRALGIDGQIVRIFDPSIHKVAPPDINTGEPADATEIDHRWVKIHRPTVIAGGELTMAELEVCEDENSHICEAPLQLKSNGGVLLIDDFGRQRMPVDELLNRWIVPLEKRYDLLNLPSGKKVQVPFDQLVIFSTNLEPKDLVDDAFLRRIPYKIQVPNPTPTQFHSLFQIMCQQIGIEYDRDAVDHLIKNHYTKASRELRACHPRDLLHQVRNYCLYEERELQLTRESMDFAVACYFSVLS